MGPLIFRIALAAGGLGMIEIGLVAAIGHGQAPGWLLIGLGMLVLIAGTAGIMMPLLGGPGDRGGEK